MRKNTVSQVATGIEKNRVGIYQIWKEKCQDSLRIVGYHNEPGKQGRGVIRRK